jgi:hypothetical protein
MEKDIQTLREILAHESIAEIFRPYPKGKYEALLEEPGEGYSIRLCQLPQDAVVIKMDRFPAPNTFFACSQGEAKRADYTVVALHQGACWAVHIELKGGKNSLAREVADQLRGSACLLRYIKGIGQRFWRDDHFLEHFEERYVSVRNLSISRQPSRLTSKNETHNEPERMLKLSAPHQLFFPRLIK